MDDGERLRVRARIDAALAPFLGLPREQRARELRALAIEADALAALHARAAEDAAALRPAPHQEAGPAEADEAAAPPEEAAQDDLDGPAMGLGVPGGGTAGLFNPADGVALALPANPDGALNDRIPLGAGVDTATPAAGGGGGVPAAAAAGEAFEGESAG